MIQFFQNFNGLKIYFSAFVVVVVVTTCFASCSSVERTIVLPPEIEGASFIGNDACKECHEPITRQFGSSPHGRYDKGDVKWAAHTGCESCHGPGSLHARSSENRQALIVNPGKDPASCFQCHLDIHMQFRLPNHHRVIEGIMNCVQCHDPHGPDIMRPEGSGLAFARLNESCGECHREQTRPFIYEHEAMREGCTTCHNPHGTFNSKMLVQNDVNLCLKCHAQIQGGGAGPGEIYIGKVPHSALIRQGTCWSAGCHTAVHGSNVHPRMLY